MEGREMLDCTLIVVAETKLENHLIGMVMGTAGLGGGKETGRKRDGSGNLERVKVVAWAASVRIARGHNAPVNGNSINSKFTTTFLSFFITNPTAVESVPSRQDMSAMLCEKRLVQDLDEEIRVAHKT